MASIKRNLPNEHGAWVLLVVGLAVGVAANPGPWQLVAGLGWLGLFLMRVPLTRLLDRRGGKTELLLASIAGAFALVSFAALAAERTASLGWALVAAIFGGVLVLLRKRRFMRSMTGEILSMLAISPLLPSMARAGDTSIDRGAAIFLMVGMSLYLVASVFRVRALSRQARGRADRGLVLLATLFFPVIALGTYAAELCDLWLVAAATPAIVGGWILLLYTKRRTLRLPVIGIFETVAVVPFAVGLVMTMPAC